MISLLWNRYTCKVSKSNSLMMGKGLVHGGGGGREEELQDYKTLELSFSYPQVRMSTAYSKRERRPFTSISKSPIQSLQCILS